jgi:hypothetical protein
VGIGTTDPDEALHVHSTCALFSSDSYFNFYIQTDRNDDGTNDDGVLQWVNGSAKTVKGEIRWDESTNTFELGHGDNQGHLAIASDGNVGIGTTGPNQKLHNTGASQFDGILYGDSAATGDIVLRSTSGNVNYSSIEIGTILNSDNGGITFSTADSSVATARMRISGTTGNVGIGDTTPDNKLHVKNVSGVAKEVVKLEQLDVDEPFILFTGTTAADQTKSLSTDTSVGSLEGHIRVSINGTDKWIPYYATN